MSLAKRLQREAEELGCSGLAERIARNIYTHTEFHASNCTKADGPFYCPGCNSDAIVKKCAKKEDHFAHSVHLTPAVGGRESELHDSCKREICELLKSRHPSSKWEIEREIPLNKEKNFPKLKPDISGRINGIPIVVEVQVSALSIQKIIWRTVNYSRRGIAILWLVPLHGPLDSRLFRPRLYERYLHSLYFGRTYYWWPNQGLTLLPVHYGCAIRHVESREWREDGVLMTGGGYETEYKIIKTPLFGREVSIDQDFRLQRRSEFTPDNERLAVPQSTIWCDALPPWWNQRG